MRHSDASYNGCQSGRRHPPALCGPVERGLAVTVVVMSAALLGCSSLAHHEGAAQSTTTSSTTTAAPSSVTSAPTSVSTTDAHPWCSKSPRPLQIRLTLPTGGSVTGPFDGPPDYDLVPPCLVPGQPSKLGIIYAYTTGPLG
jgi:uncharacterized protein YceK